MFTVLPVIVSVFGFVMDLSVCTSLVKTLKSKHVCKWLGDCAMKVCVHVCRMCMYVYVCRPTLVYVCRPTLVYRVQMCINKALSLTCVCMFWNVLKHRLLVNEVFMENNDKDDMNSLLACETNCSY